MDKKSVKIIFCISLVLILSLSLVSAGWFDWVGKITGRPVEECVDSDGGKNYFVKGSCSGEGSGTDSCISTTMLKEYFCMPQDFICIEDYYACGTGYKCELGKCVIIPPTYDGKCVGGEKGNDITAEVYAAYLNNPSLILEEACEGALYGTWTCYNDNGCVSNETCLSGKCVENILNESSINETKIVSIINCSDSDKGLNYYLEGTCSDSLGNFTDVYSGVALIEYYCLNNLCVSDAFVCGQGEGNVCKKEKSGCEELNGETLFSPVSSGTRITRDNTIYYCDVFSLEFQKAKGNKEVCSEDYECFSNDCSSGKCSSVYDEIEEQGSFLRKIWCGILHPLDVTKRNQEGETVENNGWLECYNKGVDCDPICEDRVCGASVNGCGDENVCGGCGNDWEICQEGKCFDYPKLWLGQYEGKNLQFCNSLGSCTSYGDKGSTIRSVVVYDNKLWLGQDNGILQSCDSSGTCISYGDKGKAITSMVVYDNKLWLGQYDGTLQSCDSSGNCIISLEGGYGSVNSMVVYDGLLWLCQSYGISLRSCDSLGSCKVHQDNGKSHYITSMVVYDGLLWVGELDGTFSSVDFFGNYTNYGDKGGSIYSMAIYDNKLWLGQDGGSLQSCDSSGNCMIRGNKGSDIGSIVVYDNKLWLGQYDGTLQSCDSSGNCMIRGNKGNMIFSMAVFPPEQ